ncbi:MAG: hypothetical protein ACFCVF_01155 [Kineosporiaceae bacterium]
MTHMAVWRVRVPAESVADLLAVREEGIAEAQRLCPELLRAELVQVSEDQWLEVITWSVADGEDRLMAREGEFDALNRLHALMGEVIGVDRGEVRHSRGAVAA